MFRTRAGVAVGVLSVGALILALFLVGTDPGTGDTTEAAPAEASAVADAGAPGAGATSGSVASGSAIAAVTQRFPGHRPSADTKRLLAQVGLPVEAAPALAEPVVPAVDPLSGSAQAALADSEAAVPGDLAGTAASGLAGGFPVASGAGSVGSSDAGSGAGWGAAPFGFGAPGIGGGSPVASRSACVVADCGTGGSGKPPATTTLAPLADLLAMSSTQILNPADERNNVKVEAGGPTTPTTPTTNDVPLPGSGALLGAGLLALALGTARSRRRR